MPLKIEVVDALRVIAGHPAVLGVRIQQELPTQAAILEVDFDTDLPSTWKALGESPTGVRPIETVEIFFPADYPLSAPYTTLRADFNNNLPHINPHKPGMRVPPCLVYGGALDILHSEGIHRIIDQISVWLGNARDNSLIDFSQGWEPMRRSGHDHLLRVDILPLIQKMDMGRVQIYRVWNIWTKQNFSLGQSPSKLGNVLQSKDIRAFCNSIKAGEGSTSGYTFMAICCANKNDGNLPEPLGVYLPDTVQTYADLECRAQQYGCGDSFSQLTSNLRHAISGMGNNQGFSAYIVLPVRRPAPLIGTPTDYELLAYRVKLSDAAAFDNTKEINVEAVSFITPLSSDLLRRTSGLVNFIPDIKTSFVGCGSLGSKIALHTVRAGYRPAMLVDPDFGAAHNSARHALMPRDLSRLNSKAEALANVMEEFAIKRPAVYECDVKDLNLERGVPQSIFQDEKGIVVNTTGSPAVRHYLNEAKFSARVIEACAINFGPVHNFV